jgi:hypothetical protein
LHNIFHTTTKCNKEQQRHSGTASQQPSNPAQQTNKQVQIRPLPSTPPCTHPNNTMAKKKGNARAQAAKSKGKTTAAADASSARGGSNKVLYVIAGLIVVIGVVLAVLNSDSSGTSSSVADSRKKKSLPAKRKLSTSAIIERSKTLPCKDRHETAHCAQLASTGECERTPGWMSVMCAASCDACEMLDPTVRCDPERMGMVTEPAIGAGDVDKLFEVSTTLLCESNSTD